MPLVVDAVASRRRPPPDCGDALVALADARALGQDIGSVNALNPYARASVAANAPMMAALDGLQKLFANDTYPVALARSLGLAAVNATSPVRRKIA